MPYHKFKDEQGNEYGSFETFEVGANGTEQGSRYDYEYPDGGDLGPGWYWWACFPGCMPEGEPSGPFATEEDAISDAQEA